MSDKVIKMIMLGDQNVGKTTLVQSFSGDKNQRTTAATIGVDYRNKDIIIPEIDQKFKCQVWDTAGHERFRTIT
jgi:small GTP-binding protein